MEDVVAWLAARWAAFDVWVRSPVTRGDIWAAVMILSYAVGLGLHQLGNRIAGAIWDLKRATRRDDL